MMKAGDVRAALKRHFASPEYAIAFEVAQATGFSAHRHLDAVAMDLWPSRGLALHGIEIKVDLYDWRREKANPEKAEQIARFCDYFWIAAPAKLIPDHEIPMAWGLIEIDPDGNAAEKVRAKHTEAEAVGRPFLAAMMRAASRAVDPETLDGMMAARLKSLEAGFEERVKARAQQITTARDGHREHWANLVAALGEDPDRFYDSGELIAAIKAVRTAGIAATWAGLAQLRNSLAEAHSKIAEAVKDMALPDVLLPGQRKRK